MDTLSNTNGNPRVASIETEAYAEAYGVLCAPVSAGDGRAGLSPTFCRIPAGGRTMAHAHFEPELFYIVSGSGRLTLDGEQAGVAAGDLVRIPPFARHELANTGGAELVFLSVYGEDYEVPPLPASSVVTVAPPTPNGPLHLGHLSGPYLAADVLSRHLRLRSRAVASHSGSDDHQNYVAEAARRRGAEPEAFRARMRARIERGLAAAGIEYDEFIEPVRDQAYQERVLSFARRALETGAIRPETLFLPYCGHCELFLIDALVTGRCPACDGASTGGCESCGLVVMPHELLEPLCGRCRRPTDRRPAEVHVFELGRHLPALKPDLDRLGLPARVEALRRRAEARPDLKVLVTHPAPHDTAALRLPGTRLALHVWFEMAAHYLRFALSRETWTHCFGFDNAFHYLLFIPALQRLVAPEARLPDHVLINEFLLLDGLKFSTSRGHAIWADGLEADGEHLRLFLSLHRPTTMGVSFSLENFRAFSAELDASLRHVFARAQGQAGRAPRAHRSALIDCNRLTRALELALNPASFDPRRAARRLLELIDLAARADDAESLRLRVLAVTLEPLMPRAARRLQDTLGLAPQERGWLSDWARVAVPS